MPVHYCKGPCKKLMQPVERVLGPVCGKCVRLRHKEATGG